MIRGSLDKVQVLRSGAGSKTAGQTSDAVVKFNTRPLETPPVRRQRGVFDRGSVTQNTVFKRSKCYRKLASTLNGPISKIDRTTLRLLIRNICYLTTCEDWEYDL